MYGMRLHSEAANGRNRALTSEPNNATSCPIAKSYPAAVPSFSTISAPSPPKKLSMTDAPNGRM
jgi:hypothetical protein